MFKNTIHLILGIIAFVTAVGVLLHDTQVDRAASIAIAVPLVTIGYASADSAIKSSDVHVHVERVSLARISGLRTTLPCLNPRDTTQHTQKSQKVAFLGPDSAESLWPSV